MYRLIIALALASTLSCKGAPSAGDSSSRFWKSVPDDALFYLRSTFNRAKTLEAEFQSLGLERMYSSMQTDDVPLFGFGMFILGQESWPGIDPEGPLVVAFGRFDPIDGLKGNEVGVLPTAKDAPRAMHNRVLIAAENPGALRIALDTYLAERVPNINARERPAFSAQAKNGFVQLDLLVPLDGDEASYEALRARVTEVSNTGTPLVLDQQAAAAHFTNAPGTLIGYGKADGIRTLHLAMAAVGGREERLSDMTKALGELRWLDPGSREHGELAIAVDKSAAGEIAVDAVMSLTEPGAKVFAASSTPIQMPAISGDAPTFDLVWAANLPAMLEAAEFPVWMTEGNISSIQELEEELQGASPAVFSAYITHPFTIGKTVLKLSGGFLPMGLQLPLGFHIRAWADKGPEPKAVATVVFPVGTNVDGLVGLVTGMGAAFNQEQTKLSVDSLPVPGGVALRGAFGMTLAEAFPNNAVEAQTPGFRQTGRTPPEAVAGSVPVDSRTLSAAIVGTRVLTFEGDHLRFRSITGAGPLAPASVLKARKPAPTWSRETALCAHRAAQSAFRYGFLEGQGKGDEGYEQRKTEWPELQACTAQHDALQNLDALPAPAPAP